jgi:NADPH:quinone reductase-like Zn-dependent oxidoreductase
MKAVVLTKYGSVDGLQLREVEKPTPKDNEVLIRIRATTVSAGDVELRTLKFPLWLAIPLRIIMGFIRPRDFVLGQEIAGDIEAVGKDVTGFKVGDAVFGTTGFGFGGYAEYKCVPAPPKDLALATLPTNMTYEEAASVPIGGLEALHFIRRGNIQQGQKVLIYGSGGSIGTFGVQLAKYFGAEVTAVDRADKLDMLRSIGADHVIDYTREDFTKNGQRYDVILDIVGKSPFDASIKSLTDTGRYLLVNPKMSQMMRGAWLSKEGGKQVIFGSADHNNENLIFLKELIEAGKLKSVIDRHYPLEQVIEAHRYVEGGHKKGNVVITI